MAPLLSIRNITKTFPGVRALNRVDLDIHPGEVLALMGENGAGKSTLIKILAGAQQADSGSILMDGAEVRLPTPQAARKLGISVIFQEFNLIPTMTAAENLFLGRERCRAGIVSSRSDRAAAEEFFSRVGLRIDPGALCRGLTVAQQQGIEIAKALSVNARLVIMDEPSAALTGREVEKLFGIVRQLKSEGIAVVYVSHRLDEIFAIADRIAVLRDGGNAGEAMAAETTRARLIEMMVGRSIENEFPKRPARQGDVVLRAENLARGSRVRDVSLRVRSGEVLALAGLVGAGRTETARLIFGADRAERGRIELDGKPLRLRSPRDAIAAGIALLTEDRKSQGLIPRHPIRENFSLPSLRHFLRAGMVRRSLERRAFEGYRQKLSIRIANPEYPAATLSGGNQQKVVLAKWLETNSRLLIFDEPTRGIDVKSKVEIYELINSLAEAGKAILMISSELPEVLGMADRILVMHEGRVKGEITDPSRSSQEEILGLAIA